MMKREQYLKELENTFKSCLAIANVKNRDYATNDNPFANFELSNIVVGVPTEKGIMIRLLDKVSRIGQLLDKEADVKDEKIEDTLLDLINYTAILKMYLKNKQ